ncbi:hypothetical protein LPB140_05060 [Sphingorhabdus lutea]|uniref:Thioredoxin-like fold domain-containing protein n=1 Tax=Sphingorhabdus lutea TaxID=1913578 RepID=A0A1L3JAY1_9SPHN|nr:thioredoxin domain-containing protein [Sphingorhabdus lutea]APG62276.1 hypothetical protein LPB140_05060 [Sphingorhabdus lutea]
MKKILSHTAIAILALSLASCGGSDQNNATLGKGETAAKVAAPAGTSWSTTVAESADGGYVMGNPNAPVKLVEYGALSCVHCKDFEIASMEEMKKMVDTGQMSFEFRNFMLGIHDLPSSILTRCNGPDAYFGLTEAWYANWDANMAKLKTVDQNKWAAIGNLPPDQRFVQMADLLGVGEFFQTVGVSADQAKACLSDTKAIDKLIAVTKTASKDKGVTSTPSFFINGVKLDAATWPQVKEKLQEAGAR